MSNPTTNGLLAGETYPHTATLFVPVQTVDPALTVVEWSLLDDAGTLLASGVGELGSYVQTPANTLKLVLQASIQIPAETPANPVGAEYTLQYRCLLSDGAESREFLYHESVTVVSTEFRALGPQTAVEIWGNTTNVQITLPYPNVTSVGYQVFQGNTKLFDNQDVTASQAATADGYQFGNVFDTAQFQAPDLEPFMVLWQYRLGQQTMPQTEVGRLYAVTPRILMAAQMLQQTIQRATISLDQTADVVFKPEDLLSWLHAGRAQFNAFAQPTDFTMTNASDQVMHYWVAFSAIQALRSQGLVEALKAFDYGGQQVTLSVDHAPAFNELANTIESSMKDDCRAFKLLLAKRGMTTGDGSANGLTSRYGAIGSVGITQSAVSNTRHYTNGGSWFGLNRIL